MEPEHVLKMLNRLEKVKQAEFLCGMLIPRQSATQMNGEELVKQIETTFERLQPLYKLALS